MGNQEDLQNLQDVTNQCIKDKHADMPKTILGCVYLLFKHRKLGTSHLTNTESGQA